MAKFSQNSHVFMGSTLWLGKRKKKAKAWLFGPQVIDHPNAYQVPLEKLQLPQLIERCIKGGAFLVQAPFRSGKTSHLKALEYYLKKETFVVASITINPYFDPFELLKNEIANIIKKPEPSFQFPQILKSLEQPLVLLFDEFQCISSYQLKEEFLLCLKQCLDIKQVHAIIGFGTFSLLTFAQSSIQGAKVVFIFSFNFLKFCNRNNLEKIIALFQ